MTKKDDVENVKENQEVKPQWYCFRVQSGREDTMLTALKASFVLLEKEGIKSSDYFLELSSPKRHIIRYVSGKKIEKDLCACPGYIFLKLKLTSKIQLFLRRFFQNNGFFGQILPRPITDTEYQKMVDCVNEVSKKGSDMAFRIGQRVKIQTGSFATMEGNIESVDIENQSLVVSVMIFNCETKIDAKFDQVSTIND